MTFVMIVEIYFDQWRIQKWIKDETTKLAKRGVVGMTTSSQYLVVGNLACRSRAWDRCLSTVPVPWRRWRCHGEDGGQPLVRQQRFNNGSMTNDQRGHRTLDDQSQDACQAEVAVMVHMCWIRIFNLMLSLLMKLSHQLVTELLTQHFRIVMLDAHMIHAGLQSETFKLV